MMFFAPLLGVGSIGPMEALWLISIVGLILRGMFKGSDRRRRLGPSVEHRRVTQRATDGGESRLKDARPTSPTGVRPCRYPSAAAVDPSPGLLAADPAPGKALRRRAGSAARGDVATTVDRGFRQQHRSGPRLAHGHPSGPSAALVWAVSRPPETKP
jgi:hypothetical protein